MLIEREWIDDNRLLYKATYKHPSGCKYQSYKVRAFDAAIDAYNTANAIEKWIAKNN